MIIQHTVSEKEMRKCGSRLFHNLNYIIYGTTFQLRQGSMDFFKFKGLMFDGNGHIPNKNFKPFIKRVEFKRQRIVPSLDFEHIAIACDLLDDLTEFVAYYPDPKMTKVKTSIQEYSLVALHQLCTSEEYRALMKIARL